MYLDAIGGLMKYVVRVIGLGFLLQVAASIVMVSVGTIVLNLTTGQESADVLAHPYPTLTVAMIAQALIGVVLYRRIRRLALRRVGYEPVALSVSQPGAARDLGVGLVLGLGFVGSIVALLAVLGYYRPTGVDLAPGVLYGLALGLGAAFVEEPAYRGIMLGGLTPRIGVVAATALSSVVFGLAHLVSAGGAGADELVGILGIVVSSSLVFAGAYYLTGRLWLGIGIHLAWNFAMQGIFGLTVSGLPRMEGLVQHEPVSGPRLLTGGAFGPEGSILLWLLGVGLGSTLMWLAWRKGRFASPAAPTPSD